jgi:hypothetical protein
MKKISIIHILPLENYPPILNLIKYLSNDIAIDCVSTSSKNFTEFKYNNTTIKRYNIPNSNPVFRLLAYLSFYLRTFFFLLKSKPKNVIYYETLSALPVWLYKFLYSDVSVFIHYHEYVSPIEYKNGMLINKVVHNCIERKNYSKATWISQTNHYRKQLFCKDNNLDKDIVRVFPNYPPNSWKNHRDNMRSEFLKIVFVGYSVNTSGNYIVELINWLASQNLRVELNFYLVKKNSFPNELLKTYRNLIINLNDAVQYDILPNVLKNYHIGLILYKPNSENWIYNAPNKLFEYLACDLDVWFPKDMIGALPYENTDVYPKVKSLDFKNLEAINFTELISREGLKRKTTEYFCEHVCDKLKKEILK